MVRGIYTGASGMTAKMHEMDIISNNLANVGTEGFKKDTACFKAFPEMLISRIDDNGVIKLPIGSIDTRPITGTLGTGVEVNEVFTEFSQAPLKRTDNSFDLSIDGRGFFSVLTDRGERYTRNGTFILNKENHVVTKEGWNLMGTNGPVRVEGNFAVNEKGEIYSNGEFQNTLKIIDFENNRYIKKEGNSFYRSTDLSGKAAQLSPSDFSVKQGFLEASNINPVREMVEMIKVQRSYEASQKSIHTHSDALHKLVNEMTRIV
ncbi:MAG: flagellar basal-body rod protein FlgF [Spirochaetes bacterium GWF1_41_5]|nr:MAG: flagellar basal-body rod protein FlgF [Spirochaetes bacterium GWF1_41_5]HBE02392.1 flagellar basal-body rod protein FlgF [Spirochaetia bacterium]